MTRRSAGSAAPGARAPRPSPDGAPDLLARIIARKREEVAEKKARLPEAALAARARQAPPPRPFAGALRAAIAARRPAVIAELKRASPSRGLLREDFDPAAIARSYEAGGAAALSVLTDRDFFGGADSFLGLARRAGRLPVLRKDFLIDPWQVHESRDLGADCILLIVAALEGEALRELAGLGAELGMDVLVEVHDAGELARVPALEGVILGVNNRDLRTFETSLDTTLSLRGRVPPERLLVTESGIRTRSEVALMLRHGVRGFLVGEAFMRAPDPGRRLAELFFPAAAGAGPGEVDNRSAAVNMARAPGAGAPAPDGAGGAEPETTNRAGGYER